MFFFKLPCTKVSLVISCCKYLLPIKHPPVTGMRSLKDILNRRLPRPNMSIVRSSASQTDKDRGSHPVSVERWTDFPSVLQKHQQELPDTKNRFICSLFHRTPVSISEDQLLMLALATNSLHVPGIWAADKIRHYSQHWSINAEIRKGGVCGA